MSEPRSLRGAVAGVEYVADFGPAEWPPLAGRESEWRVTAPGISFSIAATGKLVYDDYARMIIEMELAPRLLAQRQAAARKQSK